MEALNLYGVEDLRFEKDTKTPMIEKEDDVIIQVKAAGICGSDLSRYKKMGPYVPGMTFGHEFSGIVKEIGNSVDHVKEGDRVTACPAFICGECESCLKGNPSQCENLHVLGAYRPGAFSEYTKVPENHVLKIPEGLDFETAAMVEPSSVVAHGFYHANISPGSTVAVVGVGSIGLLAIQWAKIFGAVKIIAIDIDDHKLELAKQLGADVSINSLKKEPHVKVEEVTDGKGVDLAVEAAGTPITSSQVFALPKKGGSVVFMGIPYADIMMERFYFEKIVRNELKVYGSWNALSAPFPGKEWEASLHYMNTGAIVTEPMISHSLSLSEGTRAFEKMTEKEMDAVKVMLHPEE